MPEETKDGIAALWAGSFEFDPLRAVHPTAAWYRDKIGWANCSDADAAEIRLRVMDLCRQHREPGALLIVARPGGSAQGPGSRKQRRAALSLIGPPCLDMQDFRLRGPAPEPLGSYAYDGCPEIRGGELIALAGCMALLALSSRRLWRFVGKAAYFLILASTGYLLVVWTLVQVAQ